MRSGGTGRCPRAHALMSGLCRHNTRHLIFICFLLRWRAAAVVLRLFLVFRVTSSRTSASGVESAVLPRVVKPDVPCFLIRIRLPLNFHPCGDGKYRVPWRNCVLPQRFRLPVHHQYVILPLGTNMKARSAAVGSRCCKNCWLSGVIITEQ